MSKETITLEDDPVEEGNWDNGKFIGMAEIVGEEKMTYKEVMDAFNKALETPEKCEIGFWIGPDGIFHDNWDNYPKDDEALTCTCGFSHDAEDNTWTVTPWLYFADYPGQYKTLDSARQMFFFWLNWMEKLYGSDAEEPRFEKDWLTVKSNRSVLEILFDQEGERLKEKLLKNEMPREARR